MSQSFHTLRLRPITWLHKRFRAGWSRDDSLRLRWQSGIFFAEPKVKRSRGSSSHLLGRKLVHLIGSADRADVDVAHHADLPSCQAAAELLWTGVGSGGWKEGRRKLSLRRDARGSVRVKSMGPAKHSWQQLSSGIQWFASNEMNFWKRNCVL